MTTHGRLRLMALRDQADAHAQDMARQRERFTSLAAREAVRAVSAFNLFQTPEAIADMMVREAFIIDGMRILEPSAGLGRLYRAIRHRTDTHVTLVEIAPQCAAELYRETQADQQCSLIQDDFLQCDAERLGGLFDIIVMNPPFKNGIDRLHIGHALTLLKPQGKIVSLCYAGPRQRAEYQDRNGWTWTQLDPGSFRSEGTGADVAMITKTKES